MKDKAISVPYKFLEEVAEKNSCAHLNMEEPAKSHATLIRFMGKLWVCTGSISRGHKYLEVELRQVMPEKLYIGPSNNNKKRGPEYYTGGTFRANRQVFVMTGHEITLVPSSVVQPAQMTLFEEMK
jgi:hypothetical protein